MKRKLLVGFAFLGLMIASAKTYTVTLFQPSMLAGTELKAGDYKVEVKGDKVVLRSGKQETEASVKVENAPQKFGSTTVRYTEEGGKYKISEIRLGGTSTRLVLN